MTDRSSALEGNALTPTTAAHTTVVPTTVVPTTVVPTTVVPTTVVKDELARRPLPTGCCLFTETAVTLRLAGTVAVERGATRLVVVLDHPGAARRLAMAVARLTGKKPSVETALGRRPTDTLSVVRVESGAAALAGKVGLCDGMGRPVRGIPQRVLVSPGCCQAAAWGAAVLAAGTLWGGVGERRLRVLCPDLAAAMSLAMLAGRIAGGGRVPPLGPPLVLIEACELAGLLRAIGVSGTTAEALTRAPANPRACA
jgi:hypothetical protein